MKSNQSKTGAFNRRQMFLAGAIAGGAGLLGPRAARAASKLPMRGSGPEIYSMFGVKPFINCTSTYTINGGSAMLPEVIEAMNNASFYPVNFDELMEGAGKRIATAVLVDDLVEVDSSKTPATPKRRKRTEQ